MCRANPKARRQMWRSLAQVKHDGNPPRSCGRVAMQCGQMVSKAVGLSQLMKPSKHQSEDKITDGLRFVCPGCLFPHHYSPTRIITWMNIWMHGAATSTMVACTEISNHSRPTCAVYQHFHSFSHFVSCQFRVWPFFFAKNGSLEMKESWTTPNVCPCVFLFSCIRMSNCTQKPSMHTVRAPVLDSFSCLQTGWLSHRQSVEIRRVNHISLSALIVNISRRRSLLVEVGKRFSKYWMDLHTKYR